MSEFVLDTSGGVIVPGPKPGIDRYFRWETLVPLEQGYIAADLESLPYLRGGAQPVWAGFHHLAPETLAEMQHACTAFQKLLTVPLNEADGRRLWERRAAGFPGQNRVSALLRASYPPVRLTLDGKWPGIILQKAVDL